MTGLARTLGPNVHYRLALLHTWQLALVIFWLTGAGHGA